MKAIIQTKWLRFAIILTIVGCTPFSNPTITPKIPQSTIAHPFESNPSKIIAESPPLFTATHTLIHPTITPTILPSITPTRSYTPTHMPEINEGNLREVLENLIKSNGGCQLPCLLGLTPGKSDLHEINDFLYYFQRISGETDDQINGIGIPYDSILRGNVLLEFWRNNVLSFITLSIHKNSSNKLLNISLGSDVSSFSGQGPNLTYREKFDDPYYKYLMGNFFLNNVLSRYGPASQIHILLFPYGPLDQYYKNFIPTTVVLYYPEQGFMVQYVMIGREEGNDIVSCPMKSIIELSTWDPKIPISIAEASHYFGHSYRINESNLDESKPINKVTKLSNEGFYNIYKNPNTAECIRTPKNYWLLIEPLQ